MNGVHKKDHREDGDAAAAEVAEESVSEYRQINALKANARQYAESQMWSVKNFERAGIKSIMIVEGNKAAADLIKKFKKTVLLNQRGEKYMIAEIDESKIDLS
ncbi:MAG: hypothetical protein ACSHX0_06775 [Akkermansiaceae bacterium]